MLLELELNDSLRATIEKLDDDENESAKLKKKQSELLLQLWDRSAKHTSMARKSIRWPIGQVLPEEISYDDQKEVILLKGKTTKAEIPLPKAKIDSLTAASTAKTSTSAKVKTFSSFAVNPIETNDIGTLSKSVESVIEGPLKEKRWKKFLTSLEGCQDGVASGALSALEQSQLVEAIKQFTEDSDSDQAIAGDVMKTLVEAGILTYRNEDVLLRLCIESNRKNIIELVLNNSKSVLSENILAHLLKLAIGKSEKLRRKELLKILERNFSRKAMTESVGEILSTKESVEIMTELTDIYKSFDAENEDITKKALSLITILMDAHGSKIIYEDELHPKFAAISNFIIEMQSLLGTFAKFETRSEVSKEDELSSKCVVRRIQLVKHKLAW